MDAIELVVVPSDIPGYFDLAVLPPGLVLLAGVSEAMAWHVAEGLVERRATGTELLAMAKGAGARSHVEELTSD